MATKPFATEALMCATFIDLLDKRVWVAYPETAGWDILLVRRADGFQIGIQAKLSLNIEVINQAIEQHGHWSAKAEGPDCRAVLVPESGGRKLSVICDYIGVVVITIRSPLVYRYAACAPELPSRPDSWRSMGTDWHEWAPMKRHRLPEFVPDVAAGAPAPLQLTDWKIKAIKLAIILEKRGYVRRSDFVHLQLDHRRWLANEWLVAPQPGKKAAPGWVAGKTMPPFKRQHPKNYKEIAAKFKTWKPPETLL